VPVLLLQAIEQVAWKVMWHLCGCVLMGAGWIAAVIAGSLSL